MRYKEPKEEEQTGSHCWRCGRYGVTMSPRGICEDCDKENQDSQKYAREAASYTMTNEVSEKMAEKSARQGCSCCLILIIILSAIALGAIYWVVRLAMHA